MFHCSHRLNFENVRGKGCYSRGKTRNDGGHRILDLEGEGETETEAGRAEAIIVVAARRSGGAL